MSGPTVVVVMVIYVSSLIALCAYFDEKTARNEPVPVITPTWNLLRGAMAWMIYDLPARARSRFRR